MVSWWKKLSRKIQMTIVWDLVFLLVGYLVGWFITYDPGWFFADKGTRGAVSVTALCGLVAITFSLYAGVEENKRRYY